MKNLFRVLVIACLSTTAGCECTRFKKVSPSVQVNEKVVGIVYSSSLNNARDFLDVFDQVMINFTWEFKCL